MARRNLEGLDTVRRAFARMDRESAERLTDALNKGADEIAAAARQIVPVDQGDMQESIGVDRTEIRAGRGGNPTVYVVAGTDPNTQAYARALEFGRPPTPGHPGHAPRPFFFPAYWALRARVRNRVRRALNAAAKATAAANPRRFDGR